MRTLYGKLSLVLGGLLVAVGLLYMGLSHSLTEHYLQQAYQRLNRDLARNLVADRNLVSQGRLDRAALEETFHEYMVINPSIEIYLLDLQGRILAYSADPQRVKRRRVSLEPIERFLAGDEHALPLRGDDPRSHDQRKMFSVTPIPLNDPEGYLYVVLRGQEHDAIETFYRDSLLLRLAAWALGGSLLVALVTGLLLFAVLTRRLRRLAHAMEGFGGSNFDHYSPYGGDGSGDEIDQLGAHFDRLAQRMRGLVSELRQRDALRRELVDNVSHDLRTPLAALQGYLETLELKEDRLTCSQRRAYLHTALSHSRRLARLVGELFELSKLEARAVVAQSEPFPAAELVQDVVQKFQLLAQGRRVVLEARPGGEGQWIMADIGLLERVLDNLIDNALNFAPRGGRVEVRLTMEGDGMRLAVVDNGPGIPAEQLPQLFQRYHRGVRGQEAGDHAGLGLAIAHHILALHGSKLEVSSREGWGSCFSFWLPLYRLGGSEAKALVDTHRSV